MNNSASNFTLGFVFDQEYDSEPRTVASPLPTYFRNEGDNEPCENQ